MKRLIPLLCMLWFTSLAQSQAQTVWFTVMGNAQDENVNTIEVDPVPVEVLPESRVMNIRVSRSTLRQNWEGAPYRSYGARVQIDCVERKAKYISAVFFMRPLWQGEPHRTTDYTKGPVRPMLFRDVEPNPTQRIIRAACPA